MTRKNVVPFVLVVLSESAHHMIMCLVVLIKTPSDIKAFTLLTTTFESFYQRDSQTDILFLLKDNRFLIEEVWF